MIINSNLDPQDDFEREPLGKQGAIGCAILIAAMVAIVYGIIALLT